MPALSNPDGRYGRWNMTGISIYRVAPLGGVDISWIVGLIVPGILYYALGRTDIGMQH